MYCTDDITGRRPQLHWSLLSICAMSSHLFRGLCCAVHRGGPYLAGDGHILARGHSQVEPFPVIRLRHVVSLCKQFLLGIHSSVY